MGKLPSFDEWTRPWKAGELDEEAAARLVYNARKSEQEAKESLSTAKAELETVRSDLDAERVRKAEPDPEVQDQLKALLKENRELKTATGSARPEDQRKIDQLTVALELGFTATQAARLQGDTYDDLLADGKVLAKDLGIDTEDEGGEQQGQQTPAPFSRPQHTGLPQGLHVETKSDVLAASKHLPPLS